MSTLHPSLLSFILMVALMVPQRSASKKKSSMLKAGGLVAAQAAGTGGGLPPSRWAVLGAGRSRVLKMAAIGWELLRGGVRFQLWAAFSSKHAGYVWVNEGKGRWRERERARERESEPHVTLDLGARV